MTFFQKLKAEWQVICHDAWLKALLFWLPLVLSAIMWAIFSSPIARNLPIGYVDNDNSAMSRGLIRYYNASPTLHVSERFSSSKQASLALKNGSIYAYIIIPNHLEKDTTLGKSPQVSTFYNSQFILIGKLISSAIISAHTTYATQLEVYSHLLTDGGVTQSAVSEALPITTQITPLFNTNSHYGQFLVVALIPALWQILIIATIVLSLASPIRKKGLANWLTDITFTDVLIKLLPYIAIFCIQGMLYLYAFYGLLHWPMHGSWFLLFSAQLLLILACVSLATLFFFSTMDATRTMSMVAGFSAPAFAFLGVTFPTSDMPALAQIWRALLPVSHYVKIQIQQVNYGLSLHQSNNEFIYLLLFTGSLYLAKLMLNKHKSLNNSYITNNPLKNNTLNKSNNKSKDITVSEGN